MAEAKVFEAGGFVVTTERFVYGTKVIPLEDVTLAVPFVSREWKVTFMIAGLALAFLVWGGILLKVVGLLLLAGAYFFFQLSTDRALVVNVRGEGVHIAVKGTTELLHGVSGAINKVVQDRKNAHATALRADLDSLPDA